MLLTKAVVTFAVPVAGVVGIGMYYYYNSKLKEVKMPATTFYYHADEEEYPVVAKKWNETYSRISPKVTELLAKKQVTECFLGWDNPRLLISSRQSRSAVGLMVDNSVAESNLVKEVSAANKLKKAAIPESQVLTLDVDVGKSKGPLYRLLWWFMYNRYTWRYGKKMKELGVATFPLGELRTANSATLFAPVPECVKSFDFSGMPEPQLNPIGKAHQAKYAKAEPAHAPEATKVQHEPMKPAAPVAKTETVAAPVQKQQPAEPKEEAKKLLPVAPSSAKKEPELKKEEQSAPKPAEPVKAK